MLAAMVSLRPLLRNVAAALLGVVVAAVLISLVQYANLHFFPLPEGLDPTNRAAMSAYIATLPAGAFAGVLLSYFIGVAAGTWLTARVSANAHARQAMMVGMLFLVASVLNLSSLPHPIWFWAANLVLVALATWLGVYFGEPEERPLD